MKITIINSLSSIITALVLILTIPTASVFASEDITSHNKMNRPAINPDFDPDESRNFDVEQPKCIPGSEQDCPEGFGENEDSQCNSRGPCPEGYHGVDDDETGQCYPNSEGSDGYTIKDGVRYNYVLVEGDEDGESDRCARLGYLCSEYDTPDHPACNAYPKDDE